MAAHLNPAEQVKELRGTLTQPTSPTLHSQAGLDALRPLGPKNLE
jgi:hypothetical protein